MPVIPVLSLCFLLLSIYYSPLQAQNNLFFKVTDSYTKQPLRNAVVYSQRSKQSKSVGSDGRVGFTEPLGSWIFTISCYGYIDKEISCIVPSFDEGVLEIPPIALERIPLPTASVASPRSSEERSPEEATSPVDVITRQIISNSPYTELTQILHYLIASFNSNRQVIADGTDHIDPISLRGFGPDQILILINGKRRHSSALVNINNTFGRGSVSSDLNTIPLSIIQQIEVLRGDAAAQYGSDAIAGVINIVLRDDREMSKIKRDDAKKGGWILDGSYQLGIYNTKADVSFNDNTNKLSINDGLTNVFNLGVGKSLLHRGFITAGLMYIERGSTNRSGMDTRPLLYSSEPVKAINETEANYVARFQALQHVDSLLASQNGLNRRNIRAGIAEMKTISLMFNSRLQVGSQSNFYLTGGFNQKQGNAAGFYRLPRQTSQSNLTLFPNGYLPEISSNIRDISGTIGIEGMIFKWHYDISNTIGFNHFGVNISNSTNASIIGDQQTTFDAGRLEFLQNTSNIDIAKSIYPRSSFLRYCQLAFGVESRLERYSIKAGEEKSWSRGFPDDPTFKTDKIPGSQVFPGFKPSNELTKERSNFAFYGDVEAEFGGNKQTLLEGAIRYERYTDFGEKTSFKGAFRQKLLSSSQNQLNIRGNFSTGFRAPSLHQRWFNNESTQNIGGELSQVQTINYDSPIIKNIGLSDLKEETSKNFSLGLIGGKEGIYTFSLDSYWTKVNNRIVFSGQFPTTDSIVRAIVNNPVISSLQFFTNAINTETRGLEAQFRFQIPINVRHILSFSSMYNLNQTEATIVASSDKIFGDASLRNNFLFDRSENARFESFIPNNKLIIGGEYTNPKMWRLRWQVVRFGEVTYLEPGSYELGFGQRQSDQVFGACWVHDLSCSLTFNLVVKHHVSKLGIDFGVNNLLDTYPDKQFIHPRNKINNLTSDLGSNYTGGRDNTSNGRLVYSRTVTQFGANGRFFYGKVRFDLVSTR